jgi:hypothetical protein
MSPFTDIFEGQSTGDTGLEGAGTKKSNIDDSTKTIIKKALFESVSFG